MLQRIQSIFLLLTSGAFFSLFGFDFAISNKSLEGVFADQVYNVMDNPILIGLAALGGILALVSIFMFKNRPLQLRLGYLLMILSVLLLVAAILLMLGEGLPTNVGDIVDDSIGMYIPIVALITTILANRYIKKDDNLVKSSDRLR
ncbi:MAG: DUF4293 domain-containing protein [Bacteroidota bacterium]